MMQPIRSTKFWEPTNHEAPHPLPLKKQMGRPKKRRRKQEGEPRSKKMSRSGVEIRCSYCREVGHNKSGCHLKKQHQLLEQPSGGTQIGSSAAPAQEPAEGAAERPVGGPADRHADCLAEGPAEGQVQKPAEEPTGGPGSRATSSLTIAQTRRKYPVSYMYLY